MKSTTIPRGLTGLSISGAIVCLLILTGCGNRAGDRVENKGAAASSAGNDSGALAPNAASPTTSSATADKAKPVTSQPRNNDNPRVSSMPTPQVGSGGSDFFLFTQARAALGADDELKATNIVIDVKAGLLTLSGTVENAEQKSKAEQLVRAVEGVKAVKNHLRISVTYSYSSLRLCPLCVFA